MRRTRPRPAARVLAHAKVNLVLRVLAREATGYHALETVFIRVALADRIMIRVGGPQRTISCAGPMLPAEGLGSPAENLAYRAAVLFADTVGWPAGFAIDVEKWIPVGGGLGGGSADAGAVLRALNALAPDPLSSDALVALGVSLGADVAFLTTSRAFALAWGRGERLLALPAPPTRVVVLAIPPFRVATAAAYQWLAAERPDRAPTGTVLDARALSTWQGLAASSANDFEPVVASRHPAITAGLETLRASGARLVRMSGSGSTLFGVFDRRPRLAAASFPGGWTVVITRTLEGVAGVRRLPSLCGSRGAV